MSLTKSTGCLTAEQLQIIDELFESGGDEAAVLQKHNITFADWQKQLADKDFADELAARMESSKRQGRIILSKYAPYAATKLIQLCESENQETARKAALDILNLQTGRPDISNLKSQISDTKLPSLDAETASKILAVLAEK
jgi:hypothetical protein